MLSGNNIRKYKLIQSHGIVAPYPGLIYSINRILLVVVRESDGIVHGPQVEKKSDNGLSVIAHLFLPLSTMELKSYGDNFFLKKTDYPLIIYKRWFFYMM